MGGAEILYNVVVPLPTGSLRQAWERGRRALWEAPLPKDPVLTVRMSMVLLAGEEAVREALGAAVRKVAPLAVSVNGWGVYPSGTLYLQVLPSPQILRLHALVRSLLSPLSEERLPQFDGPNWRAHISLGPAVAPGDLPALVGRLRAEGYHPRAVFVASSLQLARQGDDGGWETAAHWQLG